MSFRQSNDYDCLRYNVHRRQIAISSHTQQFFDYYRRIMGFTMASHDRTVMDGSLDHTANSIHVDWIHQSKMPFRVFLCEVTNRVSIRYTHNSQAYDDLFVLCCLSTQVSSTLLIPISLKYPISTIHPWLQQKSQNTKACQRSPRGGWIQRKVTVTGQSR